MTGKLNSRMTFCKQSKQLLAILDYFDFVNSSQIDCFLQNYLMPTKSPHNSIIHVQIPYLFFQDFLLKDHIEINICPKVMSMKSSHF